MATEEQTQHNIEYTVRNTTSRGGQRLTISNRTVSKLSFLIYKDGSPTGDVTFTIRQTDDTLLASKVLGDASILETTATWEEITFDTPVLVNEEVRILVEFSGGDSSNKLVIRVQNTDVKAGEYFTWHITYLPSWSNLTSYDAAYIYTYTPAVVIPTVTYDTTTSIGSFSATYNGEITDTGNENADERGFDYGLTDSYGSEWTQSGSYGAATFSSHEAVDDLSPYRTYHVRAKAHNSAGWGYSADDTFKTLIDRPLETHLNPTRLYKTTFVPEHLYEADLISEHLYKTSFEPIHLYEAELKVKLTETYKGTLEAKHNYIATMKPKREYKRTFVAEHKYVTTFKAEHKYTARMEAK